jgi:hypothetical protein
MIDFFYFKKGVFMNVTFSCVPSDAVKLNSFLNTVYGHIVNSEGNIAWKVVHVVSSRMAALIGSAVAAPMALITAGSYLACGVYKMCVVLADRRPLEIFEKAVLDDFKGVGFSVVTAVSLLFAGVFGIFVPKMAYDHILVSKGASDSKTDSKTEARTDLEIEIENSGEFLSSIGDNQ